MTNSDIADPLFRSAVQAIDDGNISLLQQLLESNPELIIKRLDIPTEGYFQHPYLLWFVANNPVRSEKLPANIIEITNLLIKFARLHAKESFQQQIDYAYGLIETGRIPRECGVQIGLIDLLIDNGVTPGDAHGALANGNIEAAKHIIKRAGKMTLTAAICLNRVDDVKILLEMATKDEKQVALMAAAFYGNTFIMSLLIESGVDVNAFIQKGFHNHASPLHQAVYSGSLETVKLLVESGANIYATDKAYNGTPLGWSIYMQTEEENEIGKKKYKEIEKYLSVIENK